jgi:hypothetical protein
VVSHRCFFLLLPGTTFLLVVTTLMRCGLALCGEIHCIMTITSLPAHHRCHSLLKGRKLP